MFASRPRHRPSIRDIRPSMPIMNSRGFPNNLDFLHIRELKHVNPPSAHPSTPQALHSETINLPPPPGWRIFRGPNAQDFGNVWPTLDLYHGHPDFWDPLGTHPSAATRPKYEERGRVALSAPLSPSPYSLRFQPSTTLNSPVPNPATCTHLETLPSALSPRISGFGFLHPDFLHRGEGWSTRLPQPWSTALHPTPRAINTLKTCSYSFPPSPTPKAFRSRVSGIGFRVSGFESRVSGLGFQVSGLGFRVTGLGFRVSGFGFRVVG